MNIESNRFRIYYIKPKWKNERLTLQNYQLDWWFVQNISEKALETIHIELLLDQNKANFIAILSEIVKIKRLMKF
jgi:serine O-acetyltransferase